MPRPGGHIRSCEWTTVSETQPGYAALAMYDWPEVAAQNDAVWDFVRARLADQGIEAPLKLDRGLRYTQPWLRPDLLLAQTCGFPFATELRGHVQLVATPC